MKIAHAPLLALVAGLLWAAVPFTRGASLLDLLWFVAAGALLQCLMLCAWIGLGRHREMLGRVALAGTCVVAGALVLGMLLHANTHHRPLGAVTWVMLLALGSVAAVIVAARVRIAPEIAVGALGMLTAFALFRAADGIGADHALELGSGAVLFALCVGSRKALKPSVEKIWWAPTTLLVVGCGLALATGAAERLHQIAPVVAGPVGLLH